MLSDLIICINIWYLHFWCPYLNFQLYVCIGLCGVSAGAWKPEACTFLQQELRQLWAAWHGYGEPCSASCKLSQLPISPSPFSLLMSVGITGSTVGYEDTHPVKYGLILFGIIWVGSEENGEHGLTHRGEVRRIAVCWAERANWRKPWVKGVRPGWD